LSLERLDDCAEVLVRPVRLVCRSGRERVVVVAEERLQFRRRERIGQEPTEVFQLRALNRHTRNSNRRPDWPNYSSAVLMRATPQNQPGSREEAAVQPLLAPDLKLGFERCQVGPIRPAECHLSVGTDLDLSQGPYSDYQTT
jgi:hypothetical protein